MNKQNIYEPKWMGRCTPLDTVYCCMHMDGTLPPPRGNPWIVPHALPIHFFILLIFTSPVLLGATESISSTLLSPVLLCRLFEYRGRVSPVPRVVPVKRPRVTTIPLVRRVKAALPVKLFARSAAIANSSTKLKCKFLCYNTDIKLTSYRTQAYLLLLGLKYCVENTFIDFSLMFHQ